MFPKYDRLVVEPIKSPKPKPDVNSLVFGAEFTDHMLSVEWTAENGWSEPKITPYQNLSLAPSCSTLHYALEVSFTYFFQQYILVIAMLFKWYTMKYPSDK